MEVRRNTAQVKPLPELTPSHSAVRESDSVTTLPGTAPPPRVPQLVPQPEPRRRRYWLWLLIPLIIGTGIGIHLLMRSDRAGAGAGASAVADIPTYKVDIRPLEKVVRATGTTQAERYASLLVPVLEGNRSGRGRNADSSTAQVPGNAGIVVNSTSTISRSSTASRLSPTGTLSSSAGEEAGGVSGGPPSGSTAMRAATSRVGSTTASGNNPGTAANSSAQSGQSADTGQTTTTTGNVTTTSQTASTTMGATGLGSTSNELRGGSQGPGAIGGAGGGGGGGGGGAGGRRRGDYHLAVQKLFPAGKLVKKGEVVAEFDRQFMLQRLDDYRASVAQMGAGVDKARSDLAVLRKAHDQSIESSRGELEKARLDVKAAPVLSQIESEKLKLSLEEADAAHKQLMSEVQPFDVSQKAQVRNAELEVQEAKTELRRAEVNVDKLVSKAPIDGMVVLLNVFRGGEFGQVREGDELWGGMAFMQIVDPRSMMVDAKVNQVDVEKVRIGQKATVRFDAFPDLALPARVYSIGTVAKGRQFRQEYVKEVPIRLKLDQMDSRVIPDLSVSVDVTVDRQEQTAVVPVESVFRDRTPNSQPYVYVRTDSGWEERKVELALSNHIEAGVRSGLEPGLVVARRRPIMNPEPN